ncbi:MAG: hypothetical protein QNJ72_12675 [Pleurocapsa sp. MO_226.B13]|nr:hypothetical protein [Pleurocapsa sp. MO_226.B13]
MWLKKELSKNAKFQELLNQCNLTRSQIQPTKLSFLTPPAQRAKARYHNIDLLVSWGLKVLEYWKRQDFSLISTEFIIDRETLFILRDELDKTCLKKLPLLLGITAPDFIYFSEVMTKKLGQKLWEEQGKLISQAAKLGRRKFLEKLGWLLNYEKELHITAEILEVFTLGKKQLIKQGIHPLSQQDWLKLSEKFSDSAWIQSAQQKVSQYLAIEGEKIPKNQAFIATSDIIESIFGKYKIFASSSPNSDINEMILTLLLSTTKVTPDKVLQAMETIHINEVNDWSNEVFGQSMLSKRKLAFSTPTNYTKVA